MGQIGIWWQGSGINIEFISELLIKQILRVNVIGFMNIFYHILVMIITR